MSRRISFAVALLALVTGVAILIVYIQKARLAAHLRTSEDNLRQLAIASAIVIPDRAASDKPPPPAVPPATVVLPGIPPDNRLSWLVLVLPGLNQSKNPIEELLSQVDRSQPWSNERNQQAARIRLNVVLCPENTPQVAAGSPALTCYVGIAGIGADAATLPLPADGPASPRAGAFRYDAPTPYERITDGLSQTLLMGETADDPGPWLRGGPSTARGLDSAANARPLIGQGGQFGGFFPNGANFAMCDGSVRFFGPRVTPSVLLSLATISGGANEVVTD